MSRNLRSRECQCENSVCGPLIFHFRQIRSLSAALRVGSLGVNLCVNRTLEKEKKTAEQEKRAKKSGREESRRELCGMEID